jgi:SAM-dependent methyltransferase
MKYTPAYLSWRQNYQRRCIKELSRLPLHNVKSILEIGCGNGFFTEIISNLFKNVSLTCVDIDKSVESKVKNFCNRFIVANCYHLPLEKQYDLVVAHDMMHHLDIKIRDDAITEMKRVTKESGNILIVETIPNFYNEEQKKMLECRRLESLIDLKNEITPEKLLDKNNLLSLLKKNNLSIIYNAIIEYNRKFPNDYVDDWLDTVSKDINKIDDKKILTRYTSLKTRVKSGIQDLPSAIILCKK